MTLLDDIRNHLAVMNVAQRQRRTAVLLREAAYEIKRLRTIAPAEPDSPQPIDACELHARESQRLQPDRLTLTEAEREAVETADDAMQYAADELGLSQHDCDRLVATLRGLLERLTPT